MTARPEIKIGDTFFVFDGNRRIYERDENGRSVGGPIFRGHFSPVTVIGETRVSWLYGYEHSPSKAPKRDPWSVFYTEEMIFDAEWVRSHSIQIGEAVRRCGDAEMLRQVAAIVGWAEPGKR